MKKLLSTLGAVVLATSFALPLNAAPIFVPKPEQVLAGDVEQVRHRKHRHEHADRQWKRRYAHRPCDYYGRCYPRYSRYYGYRDHYRYSYRDYYRYQRRQGVTVYFNY
ncbi:MULTISPECIES: hypothetical protein [Ensifer]|uniref:hypothetical protein n=1 Tax=Ensifer TaxID=106591 RepID=UPI0009F5CA48|nr:hypothetical protein [Ensifer adhaerens]